MRAPRLPEFMRKPQRRDGVRWGTVVAVRPDGYLDVNLAGPCNPAMTIAVDATGGAAAAGMRVRLDMSGTELVAIGVVDKPNLPLAIAKGGTGLASSPSLLVDLASAAAADVLQASPRPGVTGTLPLSQGGSGMSGLQSGAQVMNGLNVQFRKWGMLCLIQVGGTATSAVSVGNPIGTISNAAFRPAIDVYSVPSSGTNPARIDIRMSGRLDVTVANLAAGSGVWLGVTYITAS